MNLISLTSKVTYSDQEYVSERESAGERASEMFSDVKRKVCSIAEVECFFFFLSLFQFHSLSFFLLECHGWCTVVASR